MKIYMTSLEGTGEVVECDSYEAVVKAGEYFASKGIKHVTLTRADVVCDFCSHNEVAWVYQIEPGHTIAPGHIDNDGKWGACQTCFTMISNGDWASLFYRSLGQFHKIYPDSSVGLSENQIEEIVSVGHSHFSRYWDGSAPAPVLSDTKFLTDLGISL